MSRRAGLRLQLVSALTLVGLLAFVPLYLAIASLARHSLRSARQEAARSVGRAVAGRLGDLVAQDQPDETLREVIAASLDPRALEAPVGATEGVTAIRISRTRGVVEAGAPAVLERLRGEREADREILGGRVVVIAAQRGASRIEVALSTGDPGSRAAPLLRLVAFYVAGFAIVLVVAAYFLLGRLIVAPIKQLVAVTRRIEEARAVPSLVGGEAGTASEVAELGVAIARTTGRLVERESALAAKVAQLEAARADLLAARDAVVRTERLASVGRLSAGLAHEVGNPIAAILGLQDVLLGGELDPETRDLVERMRRETERVHRVLRDLLDFARSGQADPGVIGRGGDRRADVATVVAAVVALVSPQPAFRQISFELALDADLPNAAIDAGRLEQVLLNLLLNAADAIDGEGTIGLRGRRTGDGVELTVDDDGPGIPDAVRASLFEPFVSTKEIGRGTGLGLAVCRGLVEGAGGTIELRERGVDRGARPGARFVVTLPACG